MRNTPSGITKRRGAEVEDTVAKRLKFDGGEYQISLMLHSLMMTEFSSRT